MLRVILEAIGVIAIIYFGIIWFKSIGKDNETATLQMKNVFHEWEEVAHIYGYVDDYEACLEFANALKKEFSVREYRCMVEY